jgi:hypothetical protein
MDDGRSVTLERVPPALARAAPLLHNVFHHVTSFGAAIERIGQVRPHRCTPHMHKHIHTHTHTHTHTRLYRHTAMPL